MTQPPGQPQGWWQPPNQPPPQHAGYPPPGGPGQPGQWNQPGHTGFGGGFQSQYGGLGAFGGEPPAPKKSKAPKFIAIGVAVVLVLGGGAAAAWYLGLFQGDVLDAASVEDGVTRVLQDSFGEQDVTSVQCPSDQQIKAGHTFECTADVAGKTKSVPIRVLNDKPEYEVGAPK